MSRYWRTQMPARKMNKESGLIDDHRRWIRDTLAHRQPRAVPYNLSLSPSVRARLEDHYATSDVEQAMELPIRMNGSKSVKPLYAAAGQVWTADYR